MTARIPGRWLMAGFLMIGLALADWAMPAPYGTILNGVFAFGAILIGGEGLRFASSRIERGLFLFQLGAGLLILGAVIWDIALAPIRQGV